MGKFKPGQTGNPNGRPKKPEIELFREALAAVEKEQGNTLLNHAVRKAFESEPVLIALLKKILPDKLAHEGSIETVSPEQRQKEVEEVKKYLGSILKK